MKFKHTTSSNLACKEEGEVRLVEGTKYAGRVEICLPNSGGGRNRTLVWGTVCHKGWDNNEATVVCRQLGFNTSTSPGKIRYKTFNAGSLMLLNY